MAKAAKIDALYTQLDTYVTTELKRIEREVALLQKVREGRGLGKANKMSKDFVGDQLVTRINTFLEGS